MVHATLVIAAGQALDAGAHSVGATGATVAVVMLLLGVVAMFGLLFWTKWGSVTGGDPTGSVEQDRRRRLNQNPAYSG
jgi:hypothetical protein